MYSHRRDRHPQLSSPHQSPFPPSQYPLFFGRMPCSSRSYPHEQQMLRAPQQRPLAHPASGYDEGGNNFDDYSRQTQSYSYWPAVPLSGETTQPARLPARCLPSPWRDVQRARLHRERGERPELPRPELPFNILPSIENDDRSSLTFPDHHILTSDSSWTSPLTPASDATMSRSPSLSDDGSISDLHQRRRPRDLVPDYVCSTPSVSPLTSPSSSSSSAAESALDRRATARPPTPPRRRQHAPSPSLSPPSVPGHPSAAPFRLSRQAGNPRLQARVLAPPPLQASRVDNSAWQPRRCHCGEGFCRHQADVNGGRLTAERGRFCGYCRAYHCA
ncbi:hypothetical protein CORC01_12562 [Colletotrichum orchidophilum]|uniref:Uncharacterized protein n=1 Tax=Colletotrichum orchidophilum TaxID=1209926 RepID=A0A1G4ASM2_9PEZI|nr:uncharacterized protein CORC01_12562 [Colletotrichum orchidophilum]OHE92159.1 hypothetical protein CORC01_12562 [Colletotrichum orchidophilum]